MKHSILGKIIFTVLVSVYASAALASGPYCGHLFSPVKESAISISKIQNNEIDLTAEMYIILSKVFAKHGFSLKTKTLREAIERVAIEIQDGEPKPSIENSDKLAKLAQEAMKPLEMILNKKQLLTAKYLFAEAILKLESISIEDYVDAEKAPWVLSHTATLKTTQFNDLVEAYVDGSAKYTNFGGDLGIISWSDIRSLYASNSWAIGIKHHDMYHLHYSYGHPYYLAVNFHSSRTINDPRYFLISSLWESVDNFRSGFEEKIASEVKTLGMTPQEGMLYLATATKEQVTELADRLGVENSMDNDLRFSKTWRPVRTVKKDGDLISLADYSKQIEAYLNDSIDRISNPDNEKYAKYSRGGPGKVSDIDEDGVTPFQRPPN